MVCVCSPANLPPVLVGPVLFRVNTADTTPASLLINATDDEPVTDLSHTMFPLGSTMFTPLGEGLFQFTWNLDSLEEDDEIPPLTIYATDSVGAVGTYTPRLEICACQNDGNCTLDGVGNTDAPVVILNCACLPGEWVT